MRYFLELSYNGTNYHGWQIQKNASSVQETLNEALSTITRAKIEVTGAGRTDTGVHAGQMFAHFDIENELEELSDLKYHLNAFLPKDIAIHDIFEVENDAHARFDAVSREYIYRINTSKDPFEENRSWYFPHDLDLNKMNEACEVVKTYKDFSCFSKSGTQTKTNLCEIKSAQWKKEGNKLIFTIRADRFLRNMVRAIVGTMIEIGQGELDLEGFKKVIESGDRSQAGFSVPAHGLYLSAIEYPKEIVS